MGKAAFVVVGCEGSGKVETNNVNSPDVAGVLSSGTGSTTAYGKQLASGGVVKTTAIVEDLCLLGGLITADAVRAVSEDTFEDGRRTSSARGSGFVNLRIGGISVPADAQPNTRVGLPRIGYVIVYKQNMPAPSSAERTQVNGLHVFVTQNTRSGSRWASSWSSPTPTAPPCASSSWWRAEGKGRSPSLPPLIRASAWKDEFSELRAYAVLRTAA